MINLDDLARKVSTIPHGPGISNPADLSLYLQWEVLTGFKLMKAGDTSPHRWLTSYAVYILRYCVKEGIQIEYTYLQGLPKDLTVPSSVEALAQLSWAASAIWAHHETCPTFYAALALRYAEIFAKSVNFDLWDAVAAHK